MQSQDEDAVRDIFQKVLDAEPALRSKIFEQATAQRPELRPRVRELLAAFEQAGDFLGEPTLNVPTVAYDPESQLESSTPLIDSPGRSIGPYQLIQKIGEGGFGLVFLAQQQHPVKRQVALKVIKLGMDTKMVVARFEGERQALALMDHPNIARVLDAGATPTGQPYFVMELVAGIPITQFCDQSALTMRDRIDLFITVCNAVQHAHQKGIIHRDIKPSNVLVTMVDAKPVPKVIDFGIAKATGQEMNQRTMLTEVGQIIGTPIYMSPEQAGAEIADIDTRSDIYSLGILLYELLTGTNPYDQESLRQANFSEIARIIREVEPPRPSARLSAGNPATTSGKTRRLAEARRLIQSIKGDLDWIVMKCLEKERSRRYESVGGLADDLHRYLNDQPIAAGPPSRRYRLKKFARRNKGLLAAASAVAAALIIGLVVATLALFSERAARHDAEVATGKEATQRGIAENQSTLAKSREQTANREAAKSNAMNGFLIDMLTYADPLRGAGPQTTVLQMLDRSRDKLDQTSAKENPEVEAALRNAIATSYQGLGNYAEAKAQLTKTLDIRKSLHPGDDPTVAESLNNLANVLIALGDFDQAEPMLKQSINMQIRLKQEENAATSQATLGQLMFKTGRIEESEPILRRALAAARANAARDPNRLLNQVRLGSALSELATVQDLRGKITEAISLLEESCNIMRQKLGPNYVGLATALNNLGATKQKNGDVAGAAPCYAESLKIYKVQLPPDHPLIAKSTFNHALILMALNSPLDEVEAAFADATERMRKLPSADRNGIAMCEDKYANVVFDRQKYALAAELWRAAYKRLGEQDGDSRNDYTDFRHTLAGKLARLYETIQQKEEAEIWKDRAGP